MAIADPFVAIQAVEAEGRSYVRVDAVGNPPEGGLAAMLDAARVSSAVGSPPAPLLLDLCGLWSFAIPDDTQWLREVLVPALAAAGVSRAAVVVNGNVHQWALRPWEAQLKAGTPSVLCLPCSWHVDEFFRSGLRREDTEGEWRAQAEAWLAGA